MDTLPSANADERVVAGFGDEWQRFDQRPLTSSEYERIFASYFRLFPWHRLAPEPEGFDLGCGSGRWARGVAPRVSKLHCVDASPKALAVAQRMLSPHPNVVFHLASVGRLPFADGSMDFAYCLGVLHHVPDPEAGLAEAVAKLKKDSPFLVYLYYSLDNRPRWFRAIWRVTDFMRRRISHLPFGVRSLCSDVLAGALYFPLAKFARLAEWFGFDPRPIPLSAYRDLSFYTMRTDALDRFGTRLERRYTRAQVTSMMEKAGLTNVTISDKPPFWCAIGWKAN